MKVPARLQYKYRLLEEVEVCREEMNRLSGVDHGGSNRQHDRVLLVPVGDAKLGPILVLQTTAVMSCTAPPGAA